MAQRRGDAEVNVNASPAETVRLYDRNFLLAFASQTCFVIANTLMAHYARWIEFLGGDLRQVGLIMGAGATAGLLLRPWMAQWINRLGSRRMWLVGYILFAISSVSNLLLEDISPAIYVIRSSLLLAAAIVFASSLTYISQTAPESRRTEGIGILGAGGFMGMLIGPWLGDFILGVGGEAASLRDRGDFSMLFVVAAVSNIIPAIFLIFMRAPSSRGMKRSVTLGDFVSTTIKYWPGRILLVDFLFGICMTAPFIFVASYIDRDSLVIAGKSVIGIFFLGYAGWGLVVRVLFRKLPDRIGPHKVLVVGILFMAAGMFAFSLVGTERATWIIVPALLTGTGHGLMFHTMTSLTIAPFPSEVRGTGSALALMMLDLGTLTGAPVLGLIADGFGFAVMFASIGFTCVVCLAIYSRRSKMPLATVRLTADSEPLNSEI